MDLHITITTEQHAALIELLSRAAELYEHEAARGASLAWLLMLARENPTAMEAARARLRLVGDAQELTGLLADY